MIINAEKRSSAEQNKLYFKKHYNDGHKDSHRISSSRLRNRSRSRSRSKERKYNTSDYFSRHIEKKQNYQRPKDSDNYYQQTTHSSISRSKDNDNYYQQNTHRSTSSHVKNWKKDKRDERKYESEVIDSSKLEETKIENISNIHEMDKDKNIGILTEAEMNKLGAKIIKAEIMGDNVCYYIIFIIYFNLFHYVFFIFIKIFLFV